MNSTENNRPFVGIVCDRYFVGEHDLHSAKNSYVRALMNCALVNAILIPATRELNSVEQYLDIVSGLLFPGGASNVEPGRYGATASPQMLLDLDRDHVSLELMRLAAKRDMPFLAICRGFQEMNVAFGGTLHSDIHQAGYESYHLEDENEDLQTRYRYRHDITFAPGSRLAALTNMGQARVNSLHRQGVSKLARPLKAEAYGPDGLIEAFRRSGSDFELGVQWHPEVSVEHDPLSRAMFEELGQSCRRYANRKADLQRKD